MGLQDGVVITPEWGVAITPESYVAIKPKICAGMTAISRSTRKFLILQILQKVIFAKMIFITPSTRNWSGKDFGVIKVLKIRDFSYVF